MGEAHGSETSRPSTCGKVNATEDPGPWLDDAPHPPYSPDMAQTDYHLSRSLSHFLDGRQFEDDEDLECGLQNFFNEESPELY
ncbi:hypothetical protein OESDEN_00672 [Oesophagostomum dentatum]|uniref:Uncharacterized protein n=1 Tax=Oesophagostomum dentatum TaxID=61180 RepID=A0A0B1TT72_OESDE|nr:hypothetical protein OESDEN_00672 [Oesophagostomum dentatum]